MSLQLKDEVLKLQSLIQQCEQEDVPVKDYYCEGMYARQINVKSGTALVGATHKKEHFYSLIEGECIIISNNDQAKIKAPYVGVSKIGEKRAIYALTDYKLITYHTVSSDKIEDIQKECIMEDVLCLG